MRARLPHRPRLLLRRLAWTAAAGLLIAAIAPGRLGRDICRASPTQPVYRDQGSSLSLAVPATGGAAGYAVSIARSPFQITTTRAGGTVLQTTKSGTTSGPADFLTAAGWATATAVQTSNWHDGVLDLTLATGSPGVTIAYRLSPSPDRYRMTWSVQGAAARRCQPLPSRVGRPLVRPGRGADDRRAGRTPSSRGRWTRARSDDTPSARPST